MKLSANACIAAFTLLGIAVSSCDGGHDLQAQAAKAYTIQRDVLGESLDAYVANNPGCKLRTEYPSLPIKGVIEGVQTCSSTNTTFAGMPVLARTGAFYQGRLFAVDLFTPTRTCHESDVLSSLKEKFGEPRTTLAIEGKEVAQYHPPDSPEFKFWQNGVSTISYLESLGTLDACSITFQLDATWEKVWNLAERLRLEEESNEKALKKKDM